MGKFICLIAGLCIAAAVTAQPKIVYLSSQTTTCDYYGKKKECFQYKYNQTDTVWKVYQGGAIRGFKYNPGYFYTLQIRQLESNMQQWGLVRVISKTKSTAQQQPGDSVTTAKPPAQLVGQWNFTRILNGAEELNLSAGKELLQFDATRLRITGRASCNNFFGNYKVDSAHAIKFEAIGHTMMACEALATENKLLKVMEMITAWRVINDTLYLKADDKTLIELRRTAPSTSPNGGGQSQD